MAINSCFCLDSCQDTTDQTWHLRASLSDLAWLVASLQSSLEFLGFVFVWGFVCLFVFSFDQLSCFLLGSARTLEFIQDLGQILEAELSSREVTTVVQRTVQDQEGRFGKERELSEGGAYPQIRDKCRD